jgi:hypothetical protein
MKHTFLTFLLLLVLLGARAQNIFRCLVRDTTYP